MSENVFETVEQFWDCECDEKYIHSKTQIECPVCGARADEMPDSRRDEILEGTHVNKSD